MSSLALPSAWENVRTQYIKFIRVILVIFIVRFLNRDTDSARPTHGFLKLALASTAFRRHIL
jgi:hypothetical protein